MIPPSAAELVDSILRDYGKIGLLIDDAEDAEGRAARTLYGCEAIPRWWLISRSLACSIQVLEQLLTRLQGSRPPRAIVVVDRYLQTSCHPQARVIPWDVPPENLGSEEKESCGKLCELVRQVRAFASPRKGIFVELETSYPHRLPATGVVTRPFSWKTRNPDLLYRMRRDIEAAHKGDLLVFGPNDDPQMPGHDFTKKGSEAAWKAHVYQSALQEIADALHGGDPVVLLTGAGASLGVSRLGRGIARTTRILEEACWHFLAQVGRGPYRTDQPRDKDLPRCVCSPAEKRWVDAEKRRWTEDDLPTTPIRWLVAHAEAGTDFESLDWQLEKLFFKEHNLAGDPDEFRRGFRAALHHQDHGFLYHHWLLAQMPWSQIITTNFDGFHERAAASAAAKAEPRKRKKILRLGNPFPLELIPEDETELTPAEKEQRQEFRKQCELFKPYGSLLKPGSVDLSAGDLQRARQRFRTSLEALLEPGSRGHLVILGHSLRDHSLDGILQELRQGTAPEEPPENLRLVWVDPVAHDRSRTAVWGHDSHRSPWDHWMRRMLEQGKAGPLPVLAHEFVHDLWRVYRQGR